MNYSLANSPMDKDCSGHSLIICRSRIRSLLTYFCNYGRFCLTILKMKIFSNFLIGELYKFGNNSENGFKVLVQAVILAAFFGPNIDPSPNVKIPPPQFHGGIFPIAW